MKRSHEFLFRLRTAYLSREKSVADVAQDFGISRRTVANIAKRDWLQDQLAARWAEEVRQSKAGKRAA